MTMLVRLKGPLPSMTDERERDTFEGRIFLQTVLRAQLEVVYVIAVHLQLWIMMV
jgi:hypothetical protein